MTKSLPISLFLLFLNAIPLLQADGPADNSLDKVRPVPPPGRAISEADRAELQSASDHLGQQIEQARHSLKPPYLDLLPDVIIFHNAVRYALAYNEFFNPTNEVPAAKSLLKQGAGRLAALQEGNAPWNLSTGLVVRGYVSKIDGSVQPYGLVIPPAYAFNPAHAFRLDAWFHGRGEELTELSFINGRQKSPGEFAPRNAFVLHLYGRYCNANKFAGEIDLFEALADVKKHYTIDENRIVMRGFSMGGAACWQFAVHYAGLWAAAAPGAGFSETADFLKVFQRESVNPPAYEQKLWHMYDSIDYAVNLFNCPTVAYSGEIDGQKQAADMMAKAMAAEGIELTHIIGPKTPHRYEPMAKEEINRRIDSIVAKGRNPVPAHVKFTTWTLRYNEMLWVTVDGMEKHWDRARIDAEIMNPNMIKITAENVSAFSLNMPSGLCPLDEITKPAVIINGQHLTASAPLSDRSWSCHFIKDGNWKLVEGLPQSGLGKRHGLQGPIDDAFMDSFVMVKPSGKPMNEALGTWAAKEQAHAIDHWRKQFRGEARVIQDDEVTDAQIASNNLILWGDPESNKVLAKIADKLPIHWSGTELRVGSETFGSDHHALVLIYPNPLNPQRYVVINSGFTFREYDYLNNARQISKLPDYAIVDVSSPVTARAPGKIMTAGFFDERWQLTP